MLYLKYRLKKLNKKKIIFFLKKTKKKRRIWVFNGQVKNKKKKTLNLYSTCHTVSKVNLYTYSYNINTTCP